MTVLTTDAAAGKGSRSWAWLAFGAMLFWGVWGIMVKLALEELNWRLLATISLFGHLIPIILLWSLWPPSIRAADRLGFGWALGLGTFGQAAFFAFYLALDAGNASVVVPLTALYPGVTLIAAVLILRESLSRVQLAGLALALIAATLLASG